MQVPVMLKLPLAILLLAVSGLVLAQDAQIRRDGRALSFSSQAAPFYSRDVPMAPLREMARHLGITVFTERNGQRIIMERGRNRLVYEQGRRDFVFNDETRPLREPSQERRTVLFLPLEMYTLFSGGLDAQRIDARPAEIGTGNTIQPERPAEASPTLFFRGDRLNFDARQKPYVRRGVTFVPLRATADRTRVKVKRSDDGEIMDLEYEGRVLRYRKGERSFNIDRARFGLNSPSEEMDGVLYVPVEMFSTLIGREFSVGSPGAPPAQNKPTPSNEYGQLKAGEWGVFSQGRFRNRLTGTALPYSSRGTLMVPLRAVAEAFGARVERGDREGVTRVRWQDQMAEYEMGERGYRHNGRYQVLPQVAEEKDGILFVPVGFFERFRIEIVRG